MRLRKIADDEIEQLSGMASRPEEPAARNARVILMASEDKDCSDIAESCQISTRTVRHIVKSFNDKGIDGLMRRASPGRPRSITQSQRETIIALIRRSPEEFGLPTERWTLADLVEIVRHDSLAGDVSSYTVRREIIRCLDELSELRAHVQAYRQEGTGAPVGNRNAVRHGAYSSLISKEDKITSSEMTRLLLKDFPRADEESVAKLARCYAVLDRAVFSERGDVLNRLDGRLRRGIKKLKRKALEAESARDEQKLTPAEWASDLLRRFNEAKETT